MAGSRVGTGHDNLFKHIRIGADRLLDKRQANAGVRLAVVEQVVLTANLYGCRRGGCRFYPDGVEADTAMMDPVFIQWVPWPRSMD